MKFLEFTDFTRKNKNSIKLSGGRLGGKVKVMGPGM